jgi:thiamine-monophosphate kinase
MGARRKASGEERLIARFFRPIATDPAALGLVDDAALLAAPADADLVVTTDAIVAGTHFFPDDPADLVAKKALRVNLSDLAAKGAEPLGAMLTLALPKGISDRWLEKFAHGLGNDCGQFGCPLLGGDTVATRGPIAISITALGQVPQGKMVRRSGAKAGDAIFVTGTIGDAALGLLLRRKTKRAAFRRLDAKAKAQLERRYLLPQPRLGLVRVLRQHANAAIDVSDGLAGDLAKLAAASGLGARISTAGVPLSQAAAHAIAAEPALMKRILSGGDDYEVLLTVPEARRVAFEAAAAAAGVAVAALGRMQAGQGVEILGDGGKPITLTRPSYSHF